MNLFFVFASTTCSKKIRLCPWSFVRFSGVGLIAVNSSIFADGGPALAQLRFRRLLPVWLQRLLHHVPFDESASR